MNINDVSGTVVEKTAQFVVIDAPGAGFVGNRMHIERRRSLDAEVGQRVTLRYFTSASRAFWYVVRVVEEG